MGEGKRWIPGSDGARGRGTMLSIDSVIRFADDKSSLGCLSKTIWLSKRPYSTEDDAKFGEKLQSPKVYFETLVHQHRLVLNACCTNDALSFPRFSSQFELEMLITSIRENCQTLSDFYPGSTNDTNPRTSKGNDPEAGLT